MKTRILFTGLAFFAITSIGFSQNIQTQGQPGRNQCNNSRFVDENKNGICDNYENHMAGQGKRNGNGFCGGNRSQGQHMQGKMNGQQGRCMNFVDENKNGICDRIEDSQKSKTESQKN